MIYTILRIALIVSLGVAIFVFLLAVLLSRINQERHYLESREAMRERELLEQRRRDAAR